MVVTTPPRPPRPSDPVERDDPEALIEEARRRARRRRRLYASVAAIALLAGVAAVTLVERTASPRDAAALAAPAAAAPPIDRPTVAFLSFPADGTTAAEVLLVSADGRSRQTLARVRADSGHNVFSWSPDGSQLAVGAAIATSGPPWFTPAIYLVNVDGSGVRTLPREWSRGGLAWAPDGRRFAFTDGRGMNTDGSGKRTLTTDGVDPVWSPDGRTIAFSKLVTVISTRPEMYGRRVDVPRGIFLMNADGSGQRMLAGDGGFGTWSPDSRRRAFTRGRHGSEQLYIANADGTGERRLTRDTSWSHGSPAWSPDGRTIAFTRDRGGHMKIWVVRPDGSGLRRLTDRGSSPAWSPDGKQIAFHSYRDGNFELYVMNADGSDQRNLSRTADRGEYEAAWVPVP